jgi:hypothetical protein
MQHASFFFFFFCGETCDICGVLRIILFVHFMRCKQSFFSKMFNASRHQFLFFQLFTTLQDIEIALHSAIGRLIFSKSPAMRRIAHSKPVIDPQPCGAKSFTAKLFAIIPLTLHLHIQLVACSPL